MAKYQTFFATVDNIELGEGGGEVSSVNVQQLSSLGWIGLKGYAKIVGVDV